MNDVSVFENIYTLHPITMACMFNQRFVYNPTMFHPLIKPHDCTVYAYVVHDFHPIKSPITKGNIGLKYLNCIES